MLRYGVHRVQHVPNKKVECRTVVVDNDVSKGFTTASTNEPSVGDQAITCKSAMTVVSNRPAGLSVEASTSSIVTQESYDGAANTQVRSKTGSGVWNTASVRTSCTEKERQEKTKKTKEKEQKGNGKGGGYCL